MTNTRQQFVLQHGLDHRRYFCMHSGAETVWGTWAEAERFQTRQDAYEKARNMGYGVWIIEDAG